LIEAWRITQRRFAAEAFSGAGARQFVGRWNRPGVSTVYLAQSRSLAILEVLAHLRRAEPIFDFVLIPAAFDEELVEVLGDNNLPKNWDREPPSIDTQILGDAWTVGGERPVLSVPSAVVPEERNYILNPSHKLFTRIRIGTPIACKMDKRLV
jgi:RES domain-containing protein